MKSILTIIAVLNFGYINAQKLGYLKPDVGYGSKSSGCFINYTAQTKKGAVVAITGYINCGQRALYSFSRDGEEYFVDTSAMYLDKRDSFILYYTSLDSNQRDSLRISTLKYAKEVIVEADRIDEAKKMSAALTYLKSFSKYGIAIWSIELTDESEYTEGTGLNIEFLNPTKKTIKYIWVSIVGINPVGDVITDPIKRQSAIKVNCIGPIKPDEFGKYNFNYVWHTDLVEDFKIKAIKIQYMDGSIQNLTNGNLAMVNRNKTAALNID